MFTAPVRSFERVTNMIKAKIVLDRDFAVSQIDPRLYSGFIEHLGRHIYTGIYEPGHPKADGNGFRTDVLDLVRELALPMIRYPGGNFVSGFNWEDSVGPVENRPTRLDLAWKTVESNRFGLHEYMKWADLCGTDTMMAVNLGTRGPDAARNLVEYCNHPGGTAWSDMRRKNGAEKPFGIKTWCLGNEMDGPWQICSKTATEYGRTAREAAKLMKWVDPNIEVVLCGSSNSGMPTFGSWELEVLEQAYENVDYLSLHHYFKNLEDDTPEFLGQPEGMNDFIRGAVAMCDAIAAKKRQSRKIMLSFDEWNVWYHSDKSVEEYYKNPWKEEPRLLEDIYNLEDALVVGGMLITMINNSDRVHIGCIAQVVNVIGPIMTEPGGACWAQTIFYPFRDVSRLGRGTALQPVVESPVYDTTTRDAVPYVAPACVLSDDGKELTVFAVNRHLREEAEVAVDLRAFGKGGTFSHSVLRGDDLKAANTLQNPNRVAPEVLAGGECKENGFKVVLPAASWNAVTVTFA